MANDKTIQVTPNVQRCLEILTEVVKSLPTGDTKEKAEGVIQYLSRTFEGEPQAGGGRTCPGGSAIIE
ncbi:unnamed protein product [marine sediment metagenome]|uniref:Uncharacterized protein n=1 Tax=marine sediment metagenome TaxID=412755 RepID=X1SFG4_9ZZZZ